MQWNHWSVCPECALYLQATQEVDGGNQDQALWAKCMALCEGDEGKAKYKYIKERVDRLRNEMVKEIEDKNIRIQTIKRRKVIEEKVNSYLNEKDTKMLRILLRNNQYDYDQNYQGQYVLTHKSEVRIFDTQKQFYDYLKELLPNLNGL